MRFCVKWNRLGCRHGHCTGLCSRVRLPVPWQQNCSSGCQQICPNDDAIRDQENVSNGRCVVSRWDVMQPLDGQLGAFDMVLDKACLDALIMLRQNAKRGIRNQIDLLREEGMGLHLF